MTREDAIDKIVYGHELDQSFSVHQLVAWKYTLEEGHEPSLDELRDYLLAGRGTFDNFWNAELKRRGLYHG